MLSVTCECGQKYTVKEHMAGKRVKCRKCGGVLGIPASTTGDESPAKVAGRDLSDLFDDLPEAKPGGGKQSESSPSDRQDDQLLSEYIPDESWRRTGSSGSFGMPALLFVGSILLALGVLVAVYFSKMEASSMSTVGFSLGVMLMGLGFGSYVMWWASS